MIPFCLLFTFIYASAYSRIQFCSIFAQTNLEPLFEVVLSQTGDEVSTKISTSP